MKLWYLCGVVLASLSVGESYSKYGRTCKDIGCLSNEMCVMESDPCSYHQTESRHECGSYPTCKRVQNAGPPSCKNYVCPPTKVCKLDGNTPKCADDTSKRAERVGYDTSEFKAGDQAGGSVYPALPRGETTERPSVGYQGPQGPGYQGGRIGSGYPGQARPNYPQQPYPGYNGYQQGGYGGYPQQGGGYPQQNGGGYPQQNGGYPQQNGYYNGYYNNQRYPNYQGGYSNPYGQRSEASGGLLDSLGSALKKYGLFYVVVAGIYERIWRL